MDFLQVVTLWKWKTLSGTADVDAYAEKWTARPQFPGTLTLYPSFVSCDLGVLAYLVRFPKDPLGRFYSHCISYYEDNWSQLLRDRGSSSGEPRWTFWDQGLCRICLWHLKSLLWWITNVMSPCIFRETQNNLCLSPLSSIFWSRNHNDWVLRHSAALCTCFVLASPQPISRYTIICLCF